MKQKTLLFTLTAGMALIVLSSSDNGTAFNNNGDRTGRLGATVTCGSSSCHSGGSGTTTCAIEVRKKSAPTGAIVTSYSQDTVYIVKIKGTHSSLSHFGFQIIAVNGVGGTSNVGTWQNLPSNARSVSNGSTGGLTLIEHNNPIAKNGSGNYEIDLEWKAPSASTATFYGIINGVNNTGSSGGDMPSTTAQVTLQKSASVESATINANIKIYPNPAINLINVMVDGIKSGTWNINVYDLRGKMIATQTNDASNGVLNASINSSRWAAGMYMIQVEKDGQQKIIPVVKQ